MAALAELEIGFERSRFYRGLARDLDTVGGEPGADRVARGEQLVRVSTTPVST
jgi:hypothetical protein